MLEEVKGEDEGHEMRMKSWLEGDEEENLDS